MLDQRRDGATDAWEETASWEFNKDCDAEIFLGYYWLRAQDLNFLCDSASAAAHRAAESPSPATLLSPTEARAPRPRRPRRTSRRSPRRRGVLLPLPRSTEARVATAAWAEDTRAGLGDTVTTLAHGTAQLVGSVDFAAEGSAAPSLASRSQQGLLRQLVEGPVLTQR